MTEKWEFCFDDMSFIKPDWKMISKEFHKAGEKNNYDFTITVYQK